MGNRALVVFEDDPGVGIYLHWSGSPEDIELFIKKARPGARSPGSDPSYALAAFIHAATNEVYSYQDGEKLSIGVASIDPEHPEDSDPGDNGIYMIGPNWEVSKL